MYICDKCCHAFYRPASSPAYLNCSMEDAREGYAQCPACGADQYGYAEYCPHCQEWVPTHEKAGVCCNACAAEIQAAFDQHLQRFIDGEPDYLAASINDSMSGRDVYPHVQGD